MATTIGKRILKAVTHAIEAHDRAQMRAVDAVLSFVESPRQTRRRSTTRRRQAARRRPVATGGQRRPH